MSKEIDDMMMAYQRLVEVQVRSQSMAQGQNYSGTGGVAAIRSAVVMGDILGVERMVRHGTDINSVLNPDGDTPLTKSILSGHSDLAVWLIEHGADIEKALGNGRTPLITAAGKGDVRVVDKLIAAGVKLDATMANGSSALMYAVAKGFVEVARKLVAAGASMDLRDNEGWGLADFARVSGMDLAQLRRPEPRRGAYGSSRIAQRVGNRYDCFAAYFQRRPFGSIPSDMIVLSLLPPVDRCLILEVLFFFGLGDRMAIVDKLSMAYCKAGWRQLSFEFLDACHDGGCLDENAYEYFVGKIERLTPHGVSVDYDDTLAKLPQYACPGDAFGDLLEAFCLEYQGNDVLASIDSPGGLDVEDMRAFIAERRQVIRAFTVLGRA